MHDHRELLPYAEVTYYKVGTTVVPMGKTEEWTHVKVCSRQPVVQDGIMFSREQKRELDGLLTMLSRAFLAGKEEQRKDVLKVLGINPRSVL